MTLWIDEAGLQFSCSCPLGDDEQFCKHCVAVALASMASSGDSKRNRLKTVESNTDLRAFLEGQEKESLIDLLLREVSENQHFG